MPKWVNPDGTRKSCAKDGCETPVTSQGLCKSHYDQLYYRATRGQGRKRYQKRNLGGDQ